MYLGHYERSKLADVLANDDCLLIRWADDPLLLSYDLDVAKHYLSTMLEEDKTYNCQVNTQKSLVNFDFVASAGKEIRKMEENERWVSWCSIYINTVTKEVKHDYSGLQGTLFSIVEERDLTSLHFT